MTPPYSEIFSARDETGMNNFLISPGFYFLTFQYVLGSLTSDIFRYGISCNIVIFILDKTT